MAAAAAAPAAGAPALGMGCTQALSSSGGTEPLAKQRLQRWSRGFVQARAALENLRAQAVQVASAVLLRRSS